MISDRADRILRYGASAEFADLYDAVGRYRYSHGDLPLRIVEAFDRCEDYLRDFEAEIEEFKIDNPKPRKGGASPA